MAMFSYILLTLATVAACLFAARIPVMTAPLVVSAAVMIAAVVMMRRGYKAKLAREVASASGRGVFDFSASIKDVLNTLERLESDQQAGCEDFHRELDRLVDGALFDFAEAREGLLAMHGFGEFARVVGEFSRGERAVNRAWSASVDGYPHEARASVGRAREIFDGLIKELDELQRKVSR
jgi:hypothetical protein